MGSASSPPTQVAAITTPAVPMTTSVKHCAGAPPSVVAQPSGVASSANRCRTTGTCAGASIRRAVASPASPSYSDASVLVAAMAESRSAIRMASRLSASVSGREWAISASTGASPAIPAYRQSRSPAGPASSQPSVTDSGSHGPSTSRTWSRTHTQAASATSRYASVVTTLTLLVGRFDYTAGQGESAHRQSRALIRDRPGRSRLMGEGLRRRQRCSAPGITAPGTGREVRCLHPGRFTRRGDSLTIA